MQNSKGGADILDSKFHQSNCRTLEPFNVQMRVWKAIESSCSRRMVIWIRWEEVLSMNVVDEDEDADEYQMNMTGQQRHQRQKD